MDDALRQAKLAKLIEIEGYDSIEELIEVVFSDAVSPAICMNADCNFACEMEPDQDAGYCDESAPGEGAAHGPPAIGEMQGLSFSRHPPSIIPRALAF
jgi:hypothetical protein